MISSTNKNEVDDMKKLENVALVLKKNPIEKGEEKPVVDLIF